MTTRVALEPAKLQAAIRQVEARIGARFPGSGLAGLAGLAASLAAIAADALARSARIRAADWRLRLVSAALLGSMAMLVRLAIRHAQPPPERIEAFQLARSTRCSSGSPGAARPWRSSSRSAAAPAGKAPAAAGSCACWRT
jgi:hypothetical protein